MLPFSGAEENVTRPLGVPSRVDCRFLSRIEPNAVHDRAPLVLGKRRASGARVHAASIAGDRKLSLGLDSSTYEGDTKCMTNNEAGTTEYALMIDWEDGNPAEFVNAESFEHAAHMARTIYAGCPSWTVGREVQPWRYARPAGDAGLTDVVADPDPRGLVE
jgi:hypothetical protein